MFMGIICSLYDLNEMEILATQLNSPYFEFSNTCIDLIHNVPTDKCVFLLIMYCYAALPIVKNELRLQEYTLHMICCS